jgi:NTP pyrophosphatase (non-canonical NTP hydrolase)
MNKLQELMVITMEECGELTQSCSKIIRKFENFEEIAGEKRDKLIEEAGDVACMIELMVELGVCTESEIQDRILTKREKLKKWSKLFD